jgi:hypothetical protein
VTIAHHADTTTTQSGTTATDNSGSYYFIRRAPDQFWNDGKSPVNSSTATCRRGMLPESTGLLATTHILCFWPTISNHVRVCQ